MALLIFFSCFLRNNDGGCGDGDHTFTADAGATPEEDVPPRNHRTAKGDGKPVEEYD